MENTEENTGFTLKEPALAYKANASSLDDILESDFRESSIAINFSDLDLIGYAKNGLVKEHLKSLTNFMGITLEQMAKLLGTTYRSLHRHGAQTFLDANKTEKAIELATFARRGKQVIGSEAGFKEWLQTPLKAFNNKKPLDFLDTTFGIQMALKTLGRLEHGVFS